jgi:hypothetical protein
MNAHYIKPGGFSPFPLDLSSVSVVVVTGALVTVEKDVLYTMPVYRCSNSLSTHSLQLNLQETGAAGAELNDGFIQIVLWNGTGDLILACSGADTINGAASVTYSGVAGDEKETIIMIIHPEAGVYKCAVMHEEGHKEISGISPNIQVSADWEVDAGHQTAGALSLSCAAGHAFGTRGADSIALGDVTGTLAAGEIVLGSGASANVAGRLSLHGEGKDS